MRRLAIASILTLSACATPAPRVETVSVNIPVPVRCIDPTSVPAEPAKTGTLPPDARAAADILGAKVLELRGYGRELVALISPCTKD